MPEPRPRELLLIPVYGDAVWGGGMTAPALGVHVRMCALAWDRVRGRGVGSAARVPEGAVPPHDLCTSDSVAARDLLVARGVWVDAGSGYLISGFATAATAMRLLAGA